MAEIRNGITLKPTKTNDKSTAAFIKKSNGIHTASAALPPLPTDNGGPGSVEAKTAFQLELVTTLKRKVKPQGVEQGDSTKNDSIEKAIEPSRTEVTLKVNKFPPKTTICTPKPDKVPGKFDTLPRSTVKHHPFSRSPVMERTSSAKPELVAEHSKSQSALNVEIKPFASSTWQKTRSPKIDTGAKSDNIVKNAILSPEVNHGSALIRPSHIKTLTRQGSRVTPAHIVETEKPVTRGPISLVEVPHVAICPPAPKTTSHAASEPTSTRTTILDTKHRSPTLSNRSEANQSAPPPKFISHPPATFTINRAGQKLNMNNYQTESKPVHAILMSLERADQEARESENQFTRFKQRQPSPMKVPPTTKTKEPSPVPGLAGPKGSYLSFSKDLGSAANNHPDTVVKKITVGTRKEDVFFENTNLRDIKIDIVENGQSRVIKK